MGKVLILLLEVLDIRYRDLIQMLGVEEDGKVEMTEVEVEVLVEPVEEEAQEVVVVQVSSTPLEAGKTTF